MTSRSHVTPHPWFGQDTGQLEQSGLWALVTKSYVFWYPQCGQLYSLFRQNSSRWLAILHLSTRLRHLGHSLGLYSQPSSSLCRWSSSSFSFPIHSHPFSFSRQFTPRLAIFSLSFFSGMMEKSFSWQWGHGWLLRYGLIHDRQACLRQHSIIWISRATLWQ